MKAYIFGTEAFVRHPEMRGVWVRTHRSVLEVDCPYVGCKAKRGELCRGAANRLVAATHAVRRKASVSKNALYGYMVVEGREVAE